MKSFILVLFTLLISNVTSTVDKVSANVQTSLAPISQASIPNIESRLGESVLLKCGQYEHNLLKQLESTVPSMPVLVNWYKHYSLTRRSDKPIYAKYLANNIDYAPHISRDYENRLQVVDKINLNISNVKAVDEALYECRLILFDKAYADSQVGSMFYLQVYVAPEFEYPNEEIVYFKPNVPIRLYCYAKGKPTPVISWYKNGKKIEANTSVLQESPSSLDDSIDIFEYRCKAENIIGQIEHTVKVIRSGSLFFTEPLKNLTVTEGTILNWPCLAQSNAEITYKWFKDSVSVQLNLHKWSDRGALFQDGMLYLLEVYRNDSGLFECHAFTDNKRIETSAYLNVQYGPEIEEFQSPFYVYDGSQSVVIDCVVKSNPQQYVLEWFKDKYLISNTNKYQILPNNSLLIRNVQKSDKGSYYCTCNNTIKKTVSSLVKLEIVESKKVELSSVYASSASVYKLPCKTLDLPFETNTIIATNEIKWFRLNSKLPQNRYTIDSNGSLVIQNLKLADSGMYLCKVSDQLLHQLNTNKNNYVYQSINNQTEKIIKLNVIQNDTSYSSAEVIVQNNSINNNKDKSPIAELPLSPSNIRVNQTKTGILVTWLYPAQTPVKIEYYQVYYRQLNEKKNEWKTSESIQANQNSYLIDDSNIIENIPFELQIVSYSQYSKSLPSPPARFKYLSNNKSSVMQFISTYSLQTTPNVVATPFTLFNLLNMSQLDVILVTIFFILLFILVVCIVACITYRRSVKRSRKKRNQKNNSKDLVDDWGFQSSAATATFLSSSSSSEKSFTIYKQNKPMRNSAIDCDLKTKLECQNKELNKKQNNNTSDELTNNYFNDNKCDYDDQDYYYSAKKKSKPNTPQRNSIVIVKANQNAANITTTTTSSTGFSSSKCNNDDNTLKSDTVCISSNSSGTGVTNTNISTNNSSNSSSSSTASSSSKSTSSDNCNLIDNSGTSSGITSGNSCISDESDESSLHITNSTKNENGFPINTIKYNAKTNILQQSSYPIKTYIKKNDMIETQLLKSGGVKNFVKFSTLNNNKNAFNSNNTKIMRTLLECQTTSLDSSRNFTPQTSSQNSSSKEDNEYLDDYCFNPNLNEEFSGISLDVDNSTTNSKEIKNYRLNTKSNKVLIMNNNFNENHPYVNNIDYYNGNNNSSSASLTPVESSAYSTTSVSPPLILKALPLSQSITQATASSSSSAVLSSQIQSSSTLNKKMNYENLSSYQYTGPFPLNSQYQNTDSSSDAQKQMFQLNSSSSLTLVSKAPSMSYCYMNNDNNSSSNDIFAKASTEPYNLETARTSVLTGTISSTASTSSSSSSGCSSLENNNNQYFHKVLNDKNVQFERINEINEKNRPNNSTFIAGNQQRNTDSLNRQYSNGQHVKKYQHFSTYKPLVKSTNNESFINGQQPLISGSIKLISSNGSNNTINKYTPYNANKGDFV